MYSFAEAYTNASHLRLFPLQRHWPVRTIVQPKQRSIFSRISRIRFVLDGCSLVDAGRYFDCELFAFCAHIKTMIEWTRLRMGKTTVKKMWNRSNFFLWPSPSPSRCRSFHFADVRIRFSRFFGIVVCLVIPLETVHILCCCCWLVVLVMVCCFPSRSNSIWMKWLIEALKVFARATFSTIYIFYVSQSNAYSIPASNENPFSNAPMKSASRRRGQSTRRKGQHETNKNVIKWNSMDDVGRMTDENIRNSCKSIFKLALNIWPTRLHRKFYFEHGIESGVGVKNDERRLEQLTMALNWRKSIFLILLNVPSVETAVVAVYIITTTTIAAATETPVAW